MPVIVKSLAIPEVKLITPVKHGDERGFFSETWNHRQWQALGVDCQFIQDNHAFSAQQGTLRGLHFQTPPHAQHKLVRVVRGSILDVAVDIRQGSPSYGQHVSAVLSAENWSQLFIPEGFAHGLLTLEPNTEVLYKVSDYYAPECDKGILWNDPALKIDWPLASTPLLSAKDKEQPMLADCPGFFQY